MSLIESPRDTVMQEDLEKLVNGEFPFDMLSGSSVMVTGSTGLIGSQIVKALACANRLLGTDINIIPFYRSRDKAERIFGDLLRRDNVFPLEGDIMDPAEAPGDIDYIIHCASATSSRYFVDHPAETIDTAVNGTKNILELARQKNVRGMVYLSSLEVYGIPPEGRKVMREDDYGYIDPLRARSSYSEGKRMTECLCASYCSEYGVPVKIARLSQTFGPGVEYNDGRVFAEFARCAIEGKNIVLHTAGGTVRTYLYTKDAVSAILRILVDGDAGCAYNATNMNTEISIRDMAGLVCGLYPESGIKVEYDFPDDVSTFGYNPEMVIVLDSSRLKDLGWESTVGLEDMFRRTIISMKESLNP